MFREVFHAPEGWGGGDLSSLPSSLCQIQIFNRGTLHASGGGGWGG